MGSRGQAKETQLTILVVVLLTLLAASSAFSFLPLIVTLLNLAPLLLVVESSTKSTRTPRSSRSLLTPAPDFPTTCLTKAVSISNSTTCSENVASVYIRSRGEWQQGGGTDVRVDDLLLLGVLCDPLQFSLDPLCLVLGPTNDDLVFLTSTELNVSQLLFSQNSVEGGTSSSDNGSVKSSRDREGEGNEIGELGSEREEGLLSR